MKLTVIGGGGVRSMFLAKSIAQRAEELHIDELVFMDNDPEKLRIYGGLAAHVARMLCPTMKFTLTSSAEEAVTDADYVITTIRVGGDATRVRDERLALDLGILGQETTGAAGVSFAMRSIPALAEYCELIKKLAKPGVKVFNFTNPAGVVSQALRDMGYDFTYGICDAPSGMLHQFADLYGVDASRIYGECYGLNHLSYFQSIKVDGKEIMPELIANDEAYAKTDMRFFEKRLLEDRGCVLNEYLYYFYYREKAVANILNAKQTRGDRTFATYCKPTAITDELLERVYTMSKGAKLVQMQEGFLPVYRKLHEEGTILIFDMGWDDELSFEKYGDYLRLADYYTPNTKEALKITGRDTPEEALRVLAEYFEHPLVKLDKDGCLILEDGRPRLLRNIPEFTCKDSTGAGDAFLAGLMYGLYHGYPFADCVRFGNITGGKSVTGVGCLTEYVQESELLALREKYKDL